VQFSPIDEHTSISTRTVLGHRIIEFWNKWLQQRDPVKGFSQDINDDWGTIQQNTKLTIGFTNGYHAKTGLSHNTPESSTVVIPAGYKINCQVLKQ
jgi:hypothetical protein